MIVGIHISQHIMPKGGLQKVSKPQQPRRPKGARQFMQQGSLGHLQPGVKTSCATKTGQILE